MGNSKFVVREYVDKNGVKLIKSKEVCVVREVKFKELHWNPKGDDSILITLPDGIRADFGIRVFVEVEK